MNVSTLIIITQQFCLDNQITGNMVSLAQNCAHARIEREMETLYNTNLNNLLEVAKSKESKQSDLDFLADLA